MTMISPVGFFLALGLLAPAQGMDNPQNLPREYAMAPPISALKSLNDTHQEAWRRPVSIDGEAAELVRYERRDGRNTGLGGEHVSLLRDRRGQLKGFTRMALELAGKALPDKVRTEQVARAFLRDTAADLLPNMEISWIKAHEETLETGPAGTRRTSTVTGMKMKARNCADGRWFWVIVGADEEVMVFERDIVWIRFPGHRQTEKWLHDDWLKKQALVTVAPSASE